jgi:hypothetical protein
MKNRASIQTEKPAENEVQQIIALSFEEFTRDAVRRGTRGMMMEEVEACCRPMRLRTPCAIGVKAPTE